MRVIIIHRYAKFEVRRRSLSEDTEWLISVVALIGLVTLTFLPLNEVTGHPSHGLSFLPIILKLLVDTFFRSRVSRARYRQADDSRHRLMPMVLPPTCYRV